MCNVSIHAYIRVWGCMLSPVQLFVTPWTVAHQVPLFMEFPMQEYWSGLPFSTPGALSDPGIKSMSPASPAFVGGFLTTASPGKSHACMHACTYNIAVSILSLHWRSKNYLASVDAALFTKQQSGAETPDIFCKADGKGNQDRTPVKLLFTVCHCLHLMCFNVFVSACCSGTQRGHIFMLLNQKADVSSFSDEAWQVIMNPKLHLWTLYSVVFFPYYLLAEILGWCVCMIFRILWNKGKPSLVFPRNATDHKCNSVWYM